MMSNRARRLLSLVTGAAFQCIVGMAATGEGPLPAYAPVIAASNQRRDAAQQALTDWRAKRDSLAARQEAAEKKIKELAGRMGAQSDATIIAVNNRIRAAEAWAQSLDAAIKGMNPASFSTLAQMAKYDQTTDEQSSLKAAIQAAQREVFDLSRKLVRRDPQGAALADEWEALEPQCVAAANEATLAQIRRDTVGRTEKALMNSIAPQPDEGKPTDEEVVRVEVPPPPGLAARVEQFRERGTPQAVRALGERFFSQMTLTLPGMEKVNRLVQGGQYGPALDAYKQYFFARLLASADLAGGEGGGDDEESHDGDATHVATVFPPPTKEQIAGALGGIVAETFPVKGTSRRIEANLGKPGAMNWVFIDPKTVENDPNGALLLDFCRRQGYPGKTGSALLHSYAVGGPKERLHRWSEVVDDWTMNWQRDVESSPLPLRDYNLLYVCRIQATRAKLKTLAQMRPSFVDDLPSTTLARLLMAMNEEYLSSAIRLGRSGLYNFRIMALNSMVPTSLKMQEFHAHQWALREGWRQVDDNFIYKIRRDGANFEFANDGHENTDQSLTMPFRAVQAWRAQPEWLEPFWGEEFMENLLSNARYWVHNMKQDGYSYRLNARSQRMRYLGANPEYKVNLLANEDEVRRRLWKVYHVGRPEAPPQVFSEGMAFQGYYYLRSGWEPNDEFLYFQSIGQPILSGREDNTGFSLYGMGGILMLAPAPCVDGRTQNVHYGLVWNPGGKANFAAYGKPNVVRNGRFLADAAFDLVEGAFEGVYQYHRPSDFFDAFGSYGYENSLAKAQAQAERAGKPFVDEPIRDVRQARRILSIRGRETYIVTDVFHSALPHRFTQDYTIYTPVRLDNLKRRLELLSQEDLKPFVADAAARTLETNNVGLPNLQVRHISAIPVDYVVQEDRRPDAVLAARGDVKQVMKAFAKRDVHHTEEFQAVQFSRKVAVNWQGQGPHVLVTLVTPQARNYALAPPPSVLRNVKPVTPRQDIAGFTAQFADGTDIGYMASVQPADLRIGSVEATASMLLVTGGRGIALDCARIAAGGQAVTLSCADFTFRIESGRVVVEKPIYRPTQPVVIEPAANVFTDSIPVTLSCATPGVEIRYTLDGTKPTPQSPLYAAPLMIDKTCRLKARAFRKGVTEDIWQQDGTHATVVYSTVFRREPLAPATEAGRAAPGLKYQYFEGIWTELVVRSLTMPARETGVLAKLLDVTPRKTDGAFGIRYEGYLDVPQDGTYTFHAPDEFIYPDIESGYDLRVFVDGREWYPAVRWHGHGTWSVALKKGKHPFKVVFVDMRLRPHKVELMWGFPHPDFTWEGVAPVLMISGPGLPKQPVPDAMLCHAE